MSLKQNEICEETAKEALEETEIYEKGLSNFGVEN
jgi:hypothetical protein